MEHPPIEVPALHRIADDVHVFTPPGHDTWGMANCTLVTSPDAPALLFDTPYDGPLTRQLQHLAAPILKGAAIGTIVNSHANGDHSYGNGLFPGTDIVSTEANLAHICAEPTPQELTQLLASTRSDTPLGWYMRHHFGRYDLTGLSTVEPTRTFTGQLTLQVGSLQADLYEVGPAHTVGDLIMHLPQRDVVCAGDIVFINDHPVHWAGTLEEIHHACQRVLALQPNTIVPGHGPVVGPDRVREYADYLEALRERIHHLHGLQWSVEETTADLLRRDAHPTWGLSERMAIAAMREYRHLDGDTQAPNLVELVAVAAGYAHARHVAVPHPRLGAPAPRPTSR
ncbi:MBL fold metallo-hydrolase [Streptomyces sp. H10-C2]|uniref:MBL fold metallo-hydrolase n=1 Tax=unclassified Streptomyces TaxID=2593676 RepID=UPI0024B8C090|nr:MULTISPECIES: MBL fold metallo-hydrolase [unclassified Streptomyces]MDJ0342814.1 MBL fold metallo-hydrolase [Streptomyces sp. PH10-H1]MDJ0372492.1 MBL fold metallo-hydrolase [Streptomyces sp. H10-C2]